MFEVKMDVLNDNTEKFENFQRYFDTIAEWLEKYINLFLLEVRPEIVPFKINDEVRAYCEQYVKDHAEGAPYYALSEDGKYYDYHRLNHLLTVAVADYLHV